MLLSQMPEAIDAVCVQLKTAISDAYRQGQQAERERIRARVKLAMEKTWKAGDWYVGPRIEIMEKFVETLMEDGDE